MIYTELIALSKEVENIEFILNLRLYQLLEDKSYLETAYKQIQEKADNLEPDVKLKFLSYSIPKKHKPPILGAFCFC